MNIIVDMLWGAIGGGVVVSFAMAGWTIFRNWRGADLPIFPDKIPCTDCGDKERLDDLYQCCDCGKLFCLKCVKPNQLERMVLLCKKCQNERKRKSDAAFPHEFAKRQSAIHGPETPRIARHER